MSVIDTLIIDRSAADVARVKALNSKDSAQWTQSERDEYLLASMRGAYNASDLNRVGQACAYLYDLISGYGYDIPGYVPLRTDWTLYDVPTQSEMSTYINTIRSFKSLWSAITDVPVNMDNISYDDANNIERLLREVYKQIELVSSIYIRSGALNAISGVGFYIAN